MIRKQKSLELIGKKIRELRLKQGFSQEELADSAGVARAYMGRVERGEQNISIQNLIKIALALKLEVGDLIPPIKDLK